MKKLMKLISVGMLAFVTGAVQLLAENSLEITFDNKIPKILICTIEVQTRNPPTNALDIPTWHTQSELKTLDPNMKTSRIPLTFTNAEAKFNSISCTDSSRTSSIQPAPSATEFGKYITDHSKDRLKVTIEDSSLMLRQSYYVSPGLGQNISSDQYSPWWGPKKSVVSVNNGTNNDISCAITYDPDTIYHKKKLETLPFSVSKNGTGTQDIPQGCALRSVTCNDSTVNVNAVDLSKSQTFNFTYSKLNVPTYMTVTSY